jgi:DNA-binding CsgD family transcriptional regulator
MTVDGAAADRRARWRYAAAIMSVVPALVVIELSREILPGGGVFLLLLVPVIVSATAFGSGPGTVALALGATGSVLLVLLRDHPWLTDPIHVSRLMLYVVEGGFVLLLVQAVSTTRRTGSTPGTLARGSSSTGLIEPLTEREREVLRLAASGRSVGSIGERLYLSRNTVKSHLSHAYAKLGAHNRTEAIAAGLHWGCIEPSALAPPASHVGKAADSPRLAIRPARQPGPGRSPRPRGRNARSSATSPLRMPVRGQVDLRREPTVRA